MIMQLCKKKYLLYLILCWGADIFHKVNRWHSQMLIITSTSLQEKMDALKYDAPQAHSFLNHITPVSNTLTKIKRTCVCWML